MTDPITSELALDAQPSLAEAPCSADGGKLTPAQLANWRNMLVGMIGPYALLMLESDIQAYKDEMQRAVGSPPNGEPSGGAQIQK